MDTIIMNQMRKGKCIDLIVPNLTFSLIHRLLITSYLKFNTYTDFYFYIPGLSWKMWISIEDTNSS